ncbi:hypothetical protein PZE06_21000 [Robertmurraya sp. DFI.2.37]|uniref:hypothetical protein n=1 Tax=Robertmurraya sp. DFI.2.37 TaxID=3031819 RepID=UPI001244A454|nr:hypothetical protein [Robertmurraya sp. DFI.2.37]MDF1510616.1 hypothetical protein [Robertmurraya sp. DFI.2.37]
MKKVMTRAWEIAREGAQKFGGKIKEYFAQALVMAWKELKEMASNKIMIIADQDRMVQVIKGVMNGKVFRSKEFTTSQKDKFMSEYNYLIHQGLNAVEFYKIVEGVETFGKSTTVK